MINFHIELNSFKLREKKKKKEWIKELVHGYKFTLGELNYIFMSDEDLLKINIEYLNHDTYTDIITFDNSENEKVIEGDIFISVDRVKENATKFNIAEENELLRVMAHGVLHLLGFKDKGDDDIQKMRRAEDEAIGRYLSA